MYYRLHRNYHQHHHNDYMEGKSPSISSVSSSSSNDVDSGLSNVEIFARKAKEIQSNRSALLEKFPKEVWFPNKNDMEWCSFCLGSNMCLEIYGEKTEGEKAMFYRRLPYRRLPLLSIVLHMHQVKVKLVLRYLHQWFLIKGMKNVISMWMYALLACLDYREFDKEQDRILNSIYKDCKNYLKNCKNWQKPRVNLLLGILEDYFVVDVSEGESE